MKKTNIALAILMALSVQYANAQTAPTSLSSAAKSAAAYQPAAWDSNQTYASAGILVSWKGKIYQSAHWTSGDEPDPIKTYGPWRLHVGAVVAPEEVPFTDPEDFELEEYDEPGSVIKPSVVVTPEEVPLTNPEDFELEEYDEPGSVIRPTVEEPTVVVPVIEKPTVVVPVIEKPVVVVPVVEKPVVEVPVIEKPVVVVPVIEKPVVVVPVIEKPVVVVPVVEKPVVVVPVVEKPVVVVPVVEKPVVEVPVVEKPVVEVDPNAIQSVAWSATKVFPTPGMTVTWKGKNYQNGWWTQGDEPGTGGVWTLFAGAVIAPVPVIEKPVVIKPISTEPSEFPLYVAGTKYKTGDVVNNAGRDFECKQAPWCSSGAPVYTPGVGGAWQSAWKMHGEAADAEDDDDRHMPSLSEALATEAKITSTDLFVKVKDSVRTLDNVEVDKVKAGRPDNPENVRRFEHLVSSEKWDYLFPQRQPAYTYENMLKAVAKFPAVCGNYDDPTNPNKAAEVCARSMATIFAHFAQETGEHDVNNQEVLEWRQGLAHVTEMGCTTAEAMASPTACAYNGECNPNTWQGQTWQCGKNADGSFKKYFGRGAKQLSYNYNYGPFSQAMFGDTKVLLDNPEWVADTWLNLASAVFFFVTPQPPKPSMLHVIDGTWQPNEYDKNSGLVPGFGVTTMIINGGVECGGATDHAASANRIKYFKEFAHSLNVDVPENEKLGCSGMQEFAGGGAGALNLSWEENYEYTPENKAEKSYACKLVNYQTPYNALLPGDYEKCVEAKFNVKLKD